MSKLISLTAAAAMFAGTVGTAMPSQAQDRYLGEIIMVGHNFCPRGTMTADGELLPISSNTALFSLLGTMYGGDGRTTFALPDLRPRDDAGQPTPYTNMRFCVVTEGIFPSRS